MKTKKGNWIIRCFSISQNKEVFNFVGSKNRNYYWRYIVIFSNNKERKIDCYSNINLEKKYPTHELINFEDWEKLPNEERKCMPHTNFNNKNMINKSKKQVTASLTHTVTSPAARLIGWKLKDEKHSENALFIARKCSEIGDDWVNDINKDLIDMYHDSCFRELLEKAGVLEIWFTPVYKEEKPQGLKHKFSFGEFEITQDDINLFKKILEL